MFDKDRGWIAYCGKKLRIPKEVCGQVISIHNGLTLIDHCLHKFEQDEISMEKNNKFYWMDGFILNKWQLIMDLHVDSWQNAFLKEAEKENFPSEFRGGFSGFIYEEDSVLLFNDHVGNHAVYYYSQDGIWICSTRVYYILELLKYNKIKLCFNVRAAEYMIEHGYMLDESTFACEIKRVLPGQTIRIFSDGKEKLTQYYSIDNRHVKQEMTEDEAVELIDKYFRQAVQREFEKDKEYGYDYLVDLSGGLDSRMVCWVAHDMGYTNQLNMTHCKNGYLDFQIAQKIVVALKHNFSFMTLDDFKWFCDAEEMARKNNGASLYMGITGGNRHFKILDKDIFGINHTGMVGDAIVGSFFKNVEEGATMQTGHECAYSSRIQYGVDKEILEKYANKELYLLNVRGLLCAQTSYFTIQTYFETCSPFLDVDFLDAILSVPLSMRCEHYIYIKWLEEKYPEATDFGWEKWRGLKPKVRNIKKAKYWKWFRRTLNRLKMEIGGCEPFHIHPTDYWYKNNTEARQWAEKYFNDRINLLRDYPDLLEDVKMMFTQGRTDEKTQAITVLVWAEFVLG